MALNPALKQVSNRNFLSPVGFKLKINKSPKVDFLAVQANLPGITLGTALQPNPYKDIDCLLYTSPSPRDRTRSRMPSSA